MRQKLVMRSSTGHCRLTRIESESFEQQKQFTHTQPDWNIQDRANLAPYEELRILVELSFRQVVLIHLKSSQPVDVAICDDDDYEYHGTHGDNYRVLHSASGVGGTNSDCLITCEVPWSGIYDIIVTNPCDESIAMAIQIIVPAKTANIEPPDAQLNSELEPQEKPSYGEYKTKPRHSPT